MQNRLLALVGEAIAAYGFERRPRKQSFLRKFGGGTMAFHLAFIVHDVDFDVTADVAVRYDDLEDLVNSIDDRLTEKEKSETYSLGAEIGNISVGAQKRWSIASESVLCRVAGDILKDFQEFAMPYYEKYTVMQNAFELLSSNDRSSWIHSPIHSSRAKRALGMALLLGRKDVVVDVFESGRRFLKSINDFGLRDYLQFAKALDISFAND